MVLLRGEAGVGKTAVINRFVAGLDSSLHVLRGWCDPLSAPRLLGPLIDALAGLDSDAAAGVAGALEAGDTTAVYRRLLDVLGSGQRWAWVIEDAHWADGATLDLLRFVGRRISALPLLLVVTYRDDEVGPEHPLAAAIGDIVTCAALARIQLDPLSQEAVATLTAGSGVNAIELHRITGGNPFYVTEILATGADRLPGGLPRSVAEAVWGRLARLSAAARDTAYAAAVCGPRAEVDLIEKVCPTAQSGLSECLGAGVLVGVDGMLGFRHELARRATLDQIPDHRRRSLHRQAMTTLAEPPVDPDMLAALAFHADQAGEDDAAVGYGLAGARRAAALGANREAAELYALVLRHARDTPADRKVIWIEQHAFARYLCGEAETAASGLREAISTRRCLHDRVGEGENLRLLSHMLWSGGRISEGLEAAGASVRLLENLGPTPQLAWSLTNMVHITGVCYDPACTQFAERAIALGTQIGDPGVVMRARCFAALASVWAGGPGWEDCEGSWHQAMATDELAEHVGLIGAAMCWTAALHHDPHRAQRYIDDLSAFCDKHELGAYQPMAVGAAALNALDRGEWIRASASAEEVLTTPRLGLINAVLPMVTRALVRARRGHTPTGQLPDGAAADAGPGDFFLLAVVWAARAEIAWLAGDDDTARTEAERGLAAAGPAADPWLTGRLQRWLHLTGATTPATPALTPYQLEISGDWQAAAAEWTRRGCPYDAALAQLGGDAPAVASALRTFHDLGGRAAARRAQQRLTELGGPRSRGLARHTKADPNGLTTRQRQVADLLAAGHSDAAIAATLHLSPRTVGHHIEAILIKLGAENRTQAAHALQQPEPTL